MSVVRTYSLCSFFYVIDLCNLHALLHSPQLYTLIYLGDYFFYHKKVHYLSKNKEKGSLGYSYGFNSSKICIILLENGHTYK